jgi:hypothetical protein
MRWTKYTALTLVSLLIVTAMAAGQGKSQLAVPEKPTVPLKVQVIIKEYKGANEVSSLPYTISVTAGDGWSGFSHLRMDLRVPTAAGDNGQFRYQDVGTDIDCRGKIIGRGLFEIELTAERSSLYPAMAARSGPASNGSALSGIAAHQPIIRRFSAMLDLVMRDGQTIESTMATDPVSGHLLKVDVTLHLVK